MKSFVCTFLALLLSGSASPFVPVQVSHKKQRCYGSATNRTEDVDGSTKTALISFLNNLNSDQNRLPCGLECTEKEQSQIVEMVDILEKDPTNKALKTINYKDLLGSWDLMYTSSRTMVINKSLSGLGRSSSELAKFASLRQTFQGSKFLGFVEYVEQIGSGPDAIDVVISGEWMLEQRGSRTAVRNELESIVYGPSKNQASEWSSLGPVKLLDIVYLDEDLEIARASVNPETLFVFQKIV